MNATTMRLALVGAPNSGKTTLFNGLTGGLAKTANYAGTTVETRTGKFDTPGGANITLIDLPGIYGLEARSTDERVAVESIRGQRGEPSPDALLLVADAANLRTHLHTILQMKSLGLPVIVSLNMIDLAERDGVKIDVPKLAQLLGVPVVATRATRKAGRDALIAKIDEVLKTMPSNAVVKDQAHDLRALQREARRIADETMVEPAMNKFTRNLDAILLHPVAGVLVLAAVLFIVFQSVFAWATPLMDGIEAFFAWLQETVSPMISNPILNGLVVDAAINGVGSVIVFLPQIVILFGFILFLEASGYMARAAFLMDELMLRVGLNGRAFIPLLSSFACAIPGIMAARTIEEERDRLTTIMVAPLMTCSARLPVYTLLIGIFIPQTMVGPFNMQGLVLFGLYVLGVVSAVLVAFILKRTATKGPSQPLIMELPTYKLPVWRDYFLGLAQKAWAFLKRAGTIIFGTTVALWILAYFPNNGAGLEGSYAGMIGGFLQPIFRPIGFNLEMTVALVPGMAAREAAVSSLGLIYALGEVDETSQALQTVLAAQWTLPMALSFIAWYVYAPQCFATLATVRRETNSWKWTGFMFAYLIGLAYVASFITFNVAKMAGL
ncbi:MAG TPA: ferrous iron transporter B [Hyphomonadaceae bacterium]|nr:ferrous iron transporter B [Hyphomonadaceae bacterium]HPN06089.1 ferrous iron transporter B [Hyphomonadaceae bacterium]